MTCPLPCNRLVVAFELCARPAPKGRPRFGNGRTYTDARTVAYETAVGLACRNAMTGPPAEGDVEVWAVFEQRDGRRSDIDNLEKSLLDGMQGVAFANDRQVTRVWKDMRVRAGIDRVSVAVLAVGA